MIMISVRYRHPRTNETNDIHIYYKHQTKMPVVFMKLSAVHQSVISNKIYH